MIETTERGLESLLARQGERVRAVLNILLESPYFYRGDDESAFHFLRRHRGEFARFFERFYGWSLVVDAKCARVYKDRWYNPRITESMRDCFNFTRRDDALGFMVLLEFFEHQLEENDMTVDDRENLRFRFGDLLEFASRRFLDLFDDEERYGLDGVRAGVLRRILPVLERYRFLRRLPPPPDENISEDQFLYEALPALYHYNSSYLARNFEEVRRRLGDGTEVNNEAEGAEGMDVPQAGESSGEEPPEVGTETFK